MLLSIITITRNDPKGLLQTLNSLAALPRHIDFEHIVVDASPEATKPALESLPKDWPLVHVQEPPSGIYAAQNKGISVAKGDLLWVLNGGDELKDLEVLLDAVLELQKHPKIDLVVGGADLYRKEAYLYTLIPKPTFKDCVIGMNRICHQAVVYRRKSFLRVGYFNTDYSIAADYEHFLKGYFVGWNALIFPFAFIAYEVSGVSAQWKKAYEQFFKIAENMKNKFDPSDWVQHALGLRFRYSRTLIMKLISWGPLGKIVLPVWYKMNRMNWPRTLRNLTWFVPLLILAQIAWQKPFYGLMDDATNLSSIVPKIEENGLLKQTLRYTKSDLEWGLFRPTYLPMVYLIYQVGANHGPTVFYLFNALIVFAILLLGSMVVSRIVSRPVWLVLLFTFCFPYTYDLFQHPSLQEKMILLVGPLWIWLAMSRIEKPAKKAALGTLLITLGYTVKASFVIYLVAGYFALFSNTSWRELGQRLTAIWLLVFGLTATFIVRRVASQGSYTSNYGIHNVWSSLFQFQSIFLIVLALSTGIFLALFYRSTFRHWARRATPLLGVLTFMAVFAPWKIGGYLFALIAPMVGGLSAQWVTLVFRSSRLWMPPAAVLLLTVGFFRPYAMFVRLKDVRNVVEMAPFLKQQGIDRVGLPCPEGSDSMGFYFRAFGGADLKTYFFEGPSSPSSSDSQPNRKVLFFDQGMCPLDVEQKKALDACKPTSIYISPYRRGYQLVQFDC